MEDPKRLILAFVIVMLILFVWQAFFLPQPQVKKRAEPQAPLELERNVPLDASEVSVPSDKIERRAEEEKELILESDRLRVRLSNYGGTIKSVYLKEYACELIKDAPYFSLQVLYNGSARRLDTLFWNFDTNLVGKDKPREISFKIEEGGILFTRRYRLSDWALTCEIEYEDIRPARVNGGENKIQFLASFNRGLSFTEKDTNDDYANFRILAHKKAFMWQMPVHKLKGEIKAPEGFTWLGFTTKYFILAVKSSAHGIDSALFFRTPDRKAGANIFLSSKEGSLPTLALGFYPLKYDLLAQKKEGLEKAVPLGWPKFLSIAILHILLFLYNLIRNYGFVIIIFSFLMKGLLFPLTRVQLRQMRKLQLLQPKLAELKRRYKDDPKTLNQETMRLYSLYKMNPLAGCLPLLAQIPIFWALYSVLRSTVELRRASFIFWIKDLSQKDPLYVLPILMGISFLFQNLLTAQDRRNIVMTIFFPVFLTVLFLNFPSGLQLYWFIFNVLSLVESLLVSRRR